MTRELLENAAINVVHCDREMEKARNALETAQLNLTRAKSELIERALAFRTNHPSAQVMPSLPPMAPAMPAPAGPWGKS